MVNGGGLAVCGLGALVGTVCVKLKKATDCVASVVCVNKLEDAVDCARVVFGQVNRVHQANSSSTSLYSTSDRPCVPTMSSIWSGSVVFTQGSCAFSV